MVDLGTLGGANSQAYGTNSDGSVVVGYSNVIGITDHAFRWNSAGMVDLGTLGGTSSYALGANSDGSVVVGLSGITGDGVTRAFRWTSAGMVDLGTLGGTNSYTYGTNADGSVVVGHADLTGNTARHAARWTSAGMVDLGTLGGTDLASCCAGIARAVSADGSVVVGHSQITGNTAFHAFRWTSAGMADLGTLAAGTNSFAHSVSADGAVVVGDSNGRAFRWTAATGMNDLNTLLANAGIDMSGITLFEARGVSGNGQFIVGTGDFFGATRAYIVRYDDGVGPTAITKDACKDGGWKNFVSSPGPFKNQGQCVSHFAQQK